MSTAPLPEQASDAPHPEAAPAPRKPEFKRFKSKFNANRLTPDQAARQGRAASKAWAALGDRDAVMLFLNSHDDALGGRPLDLAVADDEGLAKVESALAARVTGRG